MTSTARPVIPVKACYSHIGGRLGALLLEQFMEKGWIKQPEPDSRSYVMTPKGEKAFTDMGIDLTLIPRESVV